jgi:hypothetical protein
MTDVFKKTPHVLLKTPHVLSKTSGVLAKKMASFALFSNLLSKK